MVTDRCYFCPFCRIFYRFAPQAADHGTIRRVGPVPTGRAGARSSLRDRTREAAFGEEACAPFASYASSAGWGVPKGFFAAERLPGGFRPGRRCTAGLHPERRGKDWSLPDELVRTGAGNRSVFVRTCCGAVNPRRRTESCLASFVCTVADRGNALVRTYRAVSE